MKMAETEKIKELCDRIRLYNTLINEKTQEISETNRETALYRKRNGRAVKSETDLKIYQCNMKKALLEKAAASYKAERKKLRAALKEELDKSGLSQEEIEKLLAKK